MPSMADGSMEAPPIVIFLHGSHFFVSCLAFTAVCSCPILPHCLAVLINQPGKKTHIPLPGPIKAFYDVSFLF